MRKIMLIVCTVLLLGACNEPKPVNPPEMIQQRTSAVKAPELLLEGAARIGDIVVTHAYTALVHVAEAEHVPRAFQLRLVNVGDSVQSLSFLQQAVVMKNANEEAPMMMLEQQYPAQLAPYTSITLYVHAYSPTFTYDDMNFLQLGDVLLQVAPTVATIEQEDARIVQTKKLMEAPSVEQMMPLYDEGTFTSFTCPDVSFDMTCKEKDGIRVYMFSRGEERVELYTEQEALTYARVTRPDGVLEFAYENDVVKNAMWDGQAVQRTAWLYMCAWQLQDLQPIVTPNVDSTHEQNMQVEEIVAYVDHVVRPAYEKMETAINGNRLRPKTTAQVKTYALENLRKDIHTDGEWTYSAFYIDDALSFMLKIAPTRELTRYYVKDGYIARIIYPNGSMKQQIGYEADPLQAVKDGLY